LQNISRTHAATWWQKTNSWFILIIFITQAWACKNLQCNCTEACIIKTVEYLLIWQPCNWQGALAPYLPTLLSLWPLGQKARLLSWLLPLSHFRIHLLGSTDLSMSTSKRHFGAIFYIKHLCLYSRYLESEEPIFELEILHPRWL